MTDNNVQIFNLAGSRLKTGLSLSFCLLATFGGVLMVLDNKTMGYFVAMTFALVSLIFLLALLPNTVYIKVDSTGLTIKTLLFRATFIPWKSIDHFFVHEVHLGFAKHDSVAFNYVPWLNTPAIAKLRAKPHRGYEGMLPKCNAIKPDEFVALLNSYLQKAKRSDLGLHK